MNKHKITVITAFLAVMFAMTGIGSAEYNPWVDDPTEIDPALWLYVEGFNHV